MNSSSTTSASSTSLPLPSAEQATHSAQLQQRVVETIRARDGAITLGEYIHLALYQPGLGYYTAGLQKFGEAGDFITAPELGSVFARCLARSMQRVLNQLDSPVIVEIGAGSGQLAYDLLLALQQLDCVPARYQILEVSAELRARQEDLLATLPTELASCVEWLDQPSQQSFDGVIFGNEVIDALPMERFSLSQNNEILMDTVVEQAGQLQLATKEPTPVMAQAVEQLSAEVGAWDHPYHHEIRLDVSAWIDSIGRAMNRGAMMFVDYGTDRHELYSAQRSRGTLLCHYRHRAHDQLLLWPGLQDITAWVDFSALADAGLENGWLLDGYLSQAHWLLDSELDLVVSAAYEQANDMQRLRLSSQVKQLTLPGEMGERFKVMSFSRGLKTGMLSATHIGLERRL